MRDDCIETRFDREELPGSASVVGHLATRISTRTGARLAGCACAAGRASALDASRGYNWLWRYRQESDMKGVERRKESKKKPAKSPEEKRAAKREKKAGRAFRV